MKLRMFLISALLLSAACAGGSNEFATIHPALIPPPDPCKPPTFTFGLVESTPLPSSSGYLLTAYAHPTVANVAGNPFENETPVALIIDGNGYSLGHYRSIAKFLAAEGTITAVVDRGMGFDVADIDSALGEIFAAFSLADQSPVALIGHSVGGRFAIQAAVENASNPNPKNIRAVVGLAPHLTNDPPHPLTGDATEALVVIYGSQDEDVTGITTGTATEAFAAYDRAGTEASTTCGSPPCDSLATTEFEKFLAFVHGAGHPGLIQEPFCPGIGGNCLPPTAYLSTEDQFCVARGLVNAALQYKLHDLQQYRRVLTGEHVPASFHSITTETDDFLNRPAGSPVTIVHQYSPRERRVIQNFESWSGDLLHGRTSEVDFSVIDATDRADADTYLRNVTDLMIVTWPERSEPQWIGFRVPSGSRDVTSYTHLAVRAGHVRHIVGSVQPPNANQDLMLCFSDGDKNVCRTLKDALAPVDLRPNESQTSEEFSGIPAMATLAVRFPRFNGFSQLNQQSVGSVYLVFPAGTKGTIALDSIEWFRDY